VVNHSKARCREVCNAGMQTRPGERTGVKVLKCVGAAAADAPWRGSKQSGRRKPAGNSNGKLGAEMEKMLKENVRWFMLAAPAVAS